MHTKKRKKVLSPWANSISTTVPDDIRTEISVENHWEILYTNVDIIGYDETVTNADEGLNYILFYNQYTGVLKGFLYIESYVNSNNNAYWLLSIDGGTKLFNFVPEFAKPLDSTESPYQISISAITKNGLTQGFEQGWNCFMVELAYDENSMNEQLSISGYALNESTYEFTGAYNSTSEGTIVTSTNDSSNPIEGIANAFGNAGKNWINNNIGSDASKPIKIIIGGISSLIEKGISGFISAGLNLIFNSVVGSTHTSYDLQFSTNGKITVTGKSSQPSSGMIKPIAGVPLDGLGKRLGVWNLKTVPEYNVNAPLQLKGWTQNTSGKLFLCL